MTFPRVSSGRPHNGGNRVRGDVREGNTCMRDDNAHVDGEVVEEEEATTLP